MDLKYDILKHPNVSLTTDGKGKPFKHGETSIDFSSLSIINVDLNGITNINCEETTYELLSDEDFEDENNF